MPSKAYWVLHVLGCVCNYTNTPLCAIRTIGSMLVHDVVTCVQVDRIRHLLQFWPGVDEAQVIWDVLWTGLNDA